MNDMKTCNQGNGCVHLASHPRRTGKSGERYTYWPVLRSGYNRSQIQPFIDSPVWPSDKAQPSYPIPQPIVNRFLMCHKHISGSREMDEIAGSIPAAGNLFLFCFVFVSHRPVPRSPKTLWRAMCSACLLRSGLVAHMSNMRGTGLTLLSFAPGHALSRLASYAATK